MCHVNLDMKQAAIEERYGVHYNLPIYYLSDLVGLALGLSAERTGHPAPLRAELAAAKEA